MAYAPGLQPIYAPLREAAIVASKTWAFLIAIGALGLGTSLSAHSPLLGWRHIRDRDGHDPRHPRAGDRRAPLHLITETDP